MPSYSIGFCVAMTTNGRASSCVCLSTVTWRSCMHSSRPDWVLGDARFTSSTSTTFANTGPGRNSKRFSRWLKTFVPTTSAGRRSAVHWTRAYSASTERASARARAVLPTPGMVLDQHVALGDQRDHQVPERLLGSLDRPGDVLPQARAELGYRGRVEVRQRRHLAP